MPTPKSGTIHPHPSPHATPRPRARRAPGLRLPEHAAGLDQDEEWFELEQPDGTWRRIRFHDYGAIFDVPGLYERLFHDLLACGSPRRVAAMFGEVVADLGWSERALRLLDVGAGNGMVGAEFRARGVASAVGIDILPEARRAALRDRPEVYDEYCVLDLTDPDPATLELLRAQRFDCLSCVAALGFGDIPPEAFLAALELVETPGLVAFNLREDFLSSQSPSGFDRLVRELLQRGVLRVESYRRYPHRLSAAGEPLHYAAIVASKLGPAAALRRAREEHAPSSTARGPWLAP